MLPLTLQSEKTEQLVLDDGCAKRSAEYLPAVRRLIARASIRCLLEIIERVQGLIAEYTKC